MRDKAQLTRILTELCEQVAADLQRKGYVGKTIGIKLRYDDFKSVTRDQTLPTYTDNAKTIRHTARLCLRRVSLEQRLRLLGVRVGNLTKAGSPESHVGDQNYTRAEDGKKTTDSKSIDSIHSIEGQLFE